MEKAVKFTPLVALMYAKRRWLTDNMRMLPHIQTAQGDKESTKIGMIGLIIKVQVVVVRNNVMILCGNIFQI